MEEDFKRLAYAAYLLLEGDDTTEEVREILRTWEFTDENDEWIEEDDDDLIVDEDEE